MRPARVTVIGFVACCMATTVLADDSKLSQQFNTCMDQSGGVTANMLDCIHSETERQDEYLNKVYKELREQLSPSQKEALKNAQREWIKYRDSTCGLYYELGGGTMASVLASNCVMSLTVDQATLLAGFKEKD